MTAALPRIAALLALCLPRTAAAHVSEQGFVLLLPTGAYTIAGVSAVALTVMALFAVTGEGVRTLFAHRPLTPRPFARARMVTSLAATGLLAALLWLGLAGPRDPLSNLLPLAFWCFGWMLLVSLSGLLGHLWHWLNPWSGLYRLLGAPKPRLPLPEGWGLWPATLMLLAFAAFLLADIAPDDPARLAKILGLYWLATLAGLLLCGPAWLRQVELGHAVIGSLARLAPLRLRGAAGLGGPGWQVVSRPALPAAGLFALTLLAVGSFDGLNETFWWLALIGVNPLEFPGRSAVVPQTLAGLLATTLMLWALFALTVWAGLRISRSPVGFALAFGRLALCTLPIALVYHMAHYLTSFLVSAQYLLAALNDPLKSGADLLGLAPFRVTTGFFNSIASVRVIWFAQAGLVVLGHLWSILLSHRIALDLFGSNLRASFATLPLSLFMIAYTFLGLWLLAAPKGA
jgi:hypothetical protein